ncbi:MAG TPA: cation diffusion facilitator family transporter [Nakamurella sp.]|jgi:cobalt-zinc-cadmium efflux system protein
MTGGHSHSHAPETATGRHRQRLVIVVAITASIFVIQVIGGLASGSLALLADAGHMLTDSTGLLIALIAATLATRPATSARTYGLQRVEVLAAMVNGLLLTGIAVWVLVQPSNAGTSPPTSPAD